MTLFEICELTDKIAKYLLSDHRIDPFVQKRNTRDYAIEKVVQLSRASYRGGIVCLLLRDEGFDPGCCDNKLIRYASGKGYFGVVCGLMEDDRVNPSAVYNQAYRHAKHRGNFDVCERLLQDERVAIIVRNEILYMEVVQEDILKTFKRFWKKFR